MGRVKFECSYQTYRHFSHPHPLQLVNDLYPVGSVWSCSACMLEASGSIYSCTTADCNFNLHPECYELARQIKHEFDKKHVLTLQPKPLYPEGLFDCDGCGHLGNGFSYNCTPCGVDLHSTCATLPMRLIRVQCHEHELKLNLSVPYLDNAFSCDICRKDGFETWLYRCEDCEFDVHLTCVAEIVPRDWIQHKSFVPQGSRMVGPPLPSKEIFSNLKKKIVSLKKAIQTSNSGLLPPSRPSTGAHTAGNSGSAPGGNVTNPLSAGGNGARTNPQNTRFLMNLISRMANGGVGIPDLNGIGGGEGGQEFVQALFNIYGGGGGVQSLLAGGGGAGGVDPQSLAGGGGAEGVDLTSALGGDTGGGLNFLGEIFGGLNF